MESNSIESKETENADSNEMDDRISSLSDEIIGHILSFLPTKYAVLTSIFSKRWRYLWTNITNLEFCYNYARGNDNESFHDFVDNVIDQCTSKQFRRFSLTTRMAKTDRIEAWVDKVLKRNVYELILHVPVFPSCISTSNTLTILKLYFSKRSELEIPASSYFPSLRILSIELVCLSNSLMDTLFRSCPALEDLDVWAIGTCKDSYLIISSSTLKRLRFYSMMQKATDTKFVIDTPNLEYLDIYEVQIGDYVVRNLSSIAKACVNVRDIFSTLAVETMANLLKGLITVKSLSLGYNTMQALDYAYPHHLPVYRNLTRLDLTVGVHDGQRVLPHLLEVSPKLKVLILNMNRGSCAHDFVEGSLGASDWCEPQRVPECLSSCLELVEIKMALGNEYELKLMDYLLLHATHLKKLTIKPANMALERKVIFFEKLLKISSSRTCQVHLCE